jgi:hypothetical protein
LDYLQVEIDPINCKLIEVSDMNKRMNGFTPATNKDKARVIAMTFITSILVVFITIFFLWRKLEDVQLCLLQLNHP